MQDFCNLLNLTNIVQPNNSYFYIAHSARLEGVLDETKISASVCCTNNHI